MAERNLSDSKTAIFRYNINDKGYVLRDRVGTDGIALIFLFRSRFILICKVTILFGVTLLIMGLNGLSLYFVIQHL